MAMRVIYLDIDDEITSAAARVRGAEGSRVAVVLPYGSRVATSRINFRLLARDAQTNGKTLSVIAGDAATRSLAASAGLPIFSTVADYESSLAPDAHDAPNAVDTAKSKDVTAATAVTAVTSATSATDARPSARVPAAIPAERVVADTPERVAERVQSGSTSRRATGGPEAGGPEVVDRSSPRTTGRTPLLAAAAILGLALVVGGVGAFLFLPTATAVITPRETSIGPVPLRIVADPGVTTADPASLIVPAVTKTIDVETTQTFPSTGKRVEEEEAKATVRFQNLNPTGSNSIARGSVVSTGSGVRFQTDAAITLPAAELVLGDPITVVPSRKSVAVTAVDAGPDGNVEPNTITTVPRGEEPLFLKVNNPEAATGGKRDEFARITQEDVDIAAAALRTQLEALFAERIADPALAADGTTVFPATATLGEPILSVDVASLVGTEVDTFELGASAKGTVVAVDEAPIQSVAEANIESQVESGNRLIEGSIDVQPSSAVIEGGIITFPVIVTARQVAVLDPAAIETQILGLPLAEARSILDRYGQVELSVWPDWVGTIPTIDTRVEVRTP